MATKTISIELDVYDRLKALRKAPSESFSQVLRRELPEPSYWTGADIIEAIEAGKWKGVGLSEEGLRAVEEADRNDAPPRDPWSRS